MSRVEIARWIKGQRQRRGLSVAKFAQALGVTSAAAYVWEDENRTTRPDEDRVEKIAEVLGLTETDVRRGLGFWFPGVEADDTPEPPPATLTDLLNLLNQFSPEDQAKVFRYAGLAIENTLNRPNPSAALDEAIQDQEEKRRRHSA